MESVRKALWFMEGRFGGEVSLDELSQAAGISRYHFQDCSDRRVDARTEKKIGGPDILTVALDFGYSSHEAFTRAFRDQFGNG